MIETERQRLDRRFADVRRVRSGLEPNWRDIIQNILPWRQRFGPNDDRGEGIDKRNIINSTPTESLKKFSAGMMAGITSPARRWGRLTTPHIQLINNHAVKTYLADVEAAMFSFFARSNLYEELASGVYPDLGLIGAAAMFVEEDPVKIARFEALPVGEYWLDIDCYNRVDTVFRERRMTVRNIVKMFGIENVSPQTRLAFDQGALGAQVNVVHAVTPNDDYVDGALGPRGMKYASRWWETSSPAPMDLGPQTQSGFLRKGGYHEFPVMAPRWSPRPGEVYGRGPGWNSRGDCRALQHQEERLARLVDKIVDPPMKASGLRGRASLLPGDVTYYADAQQGVYEPAMRVDPAAIQYCQQHIERHEQRIEAAFFVDLWLAMLSDERNQRPTATEVIETKNEIMLQLGPLLESVNNGLLYPLFERVFGILSRAGMLPEPPQELVEAAMMDPAGGDDVIHVEFISVLHQAQKMTSITGIRELLTFVGTMAQMTKVEALDKLDADAIVNEVSDVLGTKPQLILSDDQVAEMRRVKAEQQQAQMQGQAMLAATEGVKNLSAADPQKLSELSASLSPMAQAQGGMLPEGAI